VYGEQSAKIRAQIFQTCHLLYLLHKKPAALFCFLYSENTFVKTLSVHLIKKPLQSNNLPSLRKKTFTFASQIPWRSHFNWLPLEECTTGTAAYLSDKLIISSPLNFYPKIVLRHPSFCFLNDHKRIIKGQI